MRTEEETQVTEDDIVMDVKGFRVTCVICAESIMPDSGEPPKPRTFSFGMTEDTAFCTGVVFICEKHIDSDGVISALLNRCAFLADLPL